VETTIDLLFSLLAIMGVLLSILMLCAAIADGIDALQRRPTARRPMASRVLRNPSGPAE
jgi:hypothetical protein